MQTIFKRRYSLGDPRFNFQKVQKDIKKVMKTFTSKDVYIIKITTNTYSDDYYISDYLGCLYYGELTSFDSTDELLMDSKLAEIFDVVGEKIYKLNTYAEFNYEFYIEIYRK